MIQKQTWVSVTDGTTVKWLQTFHLYKGFHRKISFVGDFIKGSARVVTPPRFEYKGFKFKYNIKGNICRGLIIRGVHVRANPARMCLKFYKNSTILIRKKHNIKSKYLYGPVPKTLMRKKFRTNFTTVI